MLLSLTGCVNLQPHMLHFALKDIFSMMQHRFRWVHEVCLCRIRVSCRL